MGRSTAASQRQGRARCSLDGVSGNLRPAFLRRGRLPIYQITGARRSVREDVDYRTRRYLISMGIRTVCFVLAVLMSGWVRWAFMIAAIVLPYLSVVFANGGREAVTAIPAAAGADHPRAIGGSDA